MFSKEAHLAAALIDQLNVVVRYSPKPMEGGRRE